MTKLKPNINPILTVHIMRDKRKAQEHLSRLVDILDSTSAQKKPDLDVIAYLKKTPLREVDV